jgi:hypothetical protein
MDNTVFYPKQMYNTSKEKKEEELNIKEKLNEFQYKEYLKKKEDDETVVRTRFTLINIDSRDRNVNPVNITSDLSKKLVSNPMSLTKNSKRIRFNMSDHKFTVNDRILIKNVEPASCTLINSIQLLSESQYALIKISEHGLTEDLISNGYNMNIEGILGISNTNKIGNIFINTLNDVFKVILFSSNSTNTTLSFFNETIDVTTSTDKIVDLLANTTTTTIVDLLTNYVVIKLPYTYRVGIETTGLLEFETTIIEYTIPDIIKLTPDSIYGIAPYYINADYPVDPSRIQGFHLITSTTTTYITVDVNVVATQTIQNTGGNNVIIAKIIKTKDGYPIMNDYAINLQQNFTNVVSVELASSEFYNSEKNIRDFPTSQVNNKLHWQNLEDGDHVYSIEIPAGFYIQSSKFITNILTKMNEIERITSTEIEKQYHNFEFIIDEHLNTISIKCFKLVKIDDKPLNITKTLINNKERLILKVKHTDNDVNIGDEFKVDGSDSIKSIKAAFINGTFTVSEVDRINQTYSAIMPFLNVELGGNDTGGGSNVSVKLTLPIKLLLDRDDTFGKILGFRDVGKINAVTKFKSEIQSSDLYELERTPLLDTTGNVLNEIVSQYNFSGQFSYFFMYMNEYKGIISNSNLDFAFSKILLSGIPGDFLFNSFVSQPVIFEEPISQLSEFRIKFLYPDGNLVQFNNIDHSFTLKITELITHPKSTRLSSKLFLKDNTFKKKDLDEADEDFDYNAGY